jgi:VanZ family protein
LLLLLAEEMQEIVPIDIPGLLEHFIAYAGSAAIAMAATAGEKAACGSLAIFGYTPASWRFSPGRDPSIADFVASAIGALCGGAAVALLLAKMTQPITARLPKQTKPKA